MKIAFIGFDNMGGGMDPNAFDLSAEARDYAEKQNWTKEGDN
jgi:3-hydroxyisobutyrate dehydrogenase-like beta-hydroxyacid dehydrogenase